MAPIDFMTEWTAKLRDLPEHCELSIKVERNDDREHLSCLLCRSGENERFDPPEHVVTFRTARESITAGLHESCRKRNARAGSEATGELGPNDPGTHVTLEVNDYALLHADAMTERARQKARAGSEEASTHPECTMCGDTLWLVGRTMTVPCSRAECTAKRHAYFPPAAVVTAHVGQTTAEFAAGVPAASETAKCEDCPTAAAKARAYLSEPMYGTAAVLCRCGVLHEAEKPTGKRPCACNGEGICGGCMGCCTVCEGDAMNGCQACGGSGRYEDQVEQTAFDASASGKRTSPATSETK